MIGFFFSSRRRHTRLRRDWSSDVCSSDLPYNNIECNIIAAQNAIGCFFAILIIGCAIARIRPKIKITNFFRYLYINLTDLSAKVLNAESLPPSPSRIPVESFSLSDLSDLPGNRPLRKSNILLTNFIIKNHKLTFSTMIPSSSSHIKLGFSIEASILKCPNAPIN